jgi:hypothetical protein
VLCLDGKHNPVICCPFPGCGTHLQTVIRLGMSAAMFTLHHMPRVHLCFIFIVLYINLLMSRTSCLHYPPPPCHTQKKK